MPRSRRLVRKDIQEAVTEQVRDLPIHAARLAMFGVGRALLLSDRVTRDYKEMRQSGVKPVLERLRNDVGQLAGKVVGRVAERVSGTEQQRPAQVPQPVEPPVTQPPGKATPAAADIEIAVGKPEPVAEPVPVAATPEPVAATPEPVPAMPEPEPVAATPAPAPTSTATTPTPEPVAAAPEPKPEPAPAKFATRSLPVPDYDAATLASVRARLRALSAAQVSVLREYEAANAARADFLRMFDNRIAKLTGHN